ncbi:MAG: hypothetical protein ACREHC_00255 [Candidatus Levyibacteriota bacterium]
MARTNQNDFSADILAKSEKHETDIGELSTRVKALEDKFSTNEKIADTLCETAEKATKMQNMLSGSFIKLIQNDVHVKEAIQKQIRVSDKNAFQSWMKKFGGIVLAIIIYILGLVSQPIVQLIFDNITHVKK